MPRFLSWLAIGLASAFLVVATAAFSLTTVTWLAFATGIATLVLSLGVAYGYRGHIATVLVAGATAVVSAWTIVASLVFAQATVQNLALASGLAVAALAIVGLSAHELSSEHAIARRATTADGSEPRLATAA